MSTTRPPTEPGYRPIWDHEVEGVPTVRVAARDVDASGVHVEYEILHDPCDDADGTIRMSGVRIHFQHGTVQEYGINGVTHEALLAVVADRLRGFQAAEFPCRENAIAITKIEEALMWLQRRTRDRVRRGVEGKTEA